MTITVGRAAASPGATRSTPARAAAAAATAVTTTTAAATSKQRHTRKRCGHGKSRARNAFEPGTGSGTTAAGALPSERDDARARERAAGRAGEETGARGSRPCACPVGRGHPRPAAVGREQRRRACGRRGRAGSGAGPEGRRLERRAVGRLEREDAARREDRADSARGPQRRARRRRQAQVVVRGRGPQGDRDRSGRRRLVEARRGAPALPRLRLRLPRVDREEPGDAGRRGARRRGIGDRAAARVDRPEHGRDPAARDGQLVVLRRRPRSLRRRGLQEDARPSRASPPSPRPGGSSSPGTAAAGSRRPRRQRPSRRKRAPTRGSGWPRLRSSSSTRSTAPASSPT